MAKISASEVQPVSVKSEKLLNLKFIHTHTPVFAAGINLGDKLDVTKRAGMFLQYDPKKEFYLIWINSQLVRLPKSSVHADTPLNQEDTNYTHPKLEITPAPIQTSAPANPLIQAQVSGPTHHVFQEGPGLTGVGQRIK